MKRTRRTFLNAVGSTAATLALPSIAAPARPVVGISLPLSGVQAVPAAEMKAGYEAALGAVADLVVVDDESKPQATATMIDQFAKDDRIVATTGIVGTPHAKSALPYAKLGFTVLAYQSDPELVTEGPK